MSRGKAVLIGRDLVSCGSVAGVGEGAQDGEPKSQTVTAGNGGGDHQKKAPPAPATACAPRRPFPLLMLCGAPHM